MTADSAVESSGLNERSVDVVDAQIAPTPAAYTVIWESHRPPTSCTTIPKKADIIDTGVCYKA